MPDKAAPVKPLFSASLPELPLAKEPRVPPTTLLNILARVGLLMPATFAGELPVALKPCKPPDTAPPRKPLPKLPPWAAVILPEASPCPAAPPKKPPPNIPDKAPPKPPVATIGATIPINLVKLSSSFC